MTDAAHDFHIANATNMVGRELGTSDWLLVDQERVTSFGLATGHDHWLHLDPARAARESPYGGTIVQGFLLVGLILHFIEHMGLRPVDAAFALNYGLDRARFFAANNTQKTQEPRGSHAHAHAWAWTWTCQNRGQGGMCMHM